MKLLVLLTLIQLPSQHFEFHYLPGQESLAQEMAELAQEAHKKIHLDLGIQDTRRISVFLVQNIDQMREVAPAKAYVPAWAAGMAFSRHDRIILRTDAGSRRRGSLHEVFTHELAHLALSQATAHKKIPRWFHEGFAIYQSGEWSLGRVTALSSGVLANRLFSLHMLDDSFPASAPAEVELAYAQSIDFVAYILGRFGTKAFAKLIRLVAKGTVFWLAMEEAFDINAKVLEKQWRQDLSSRFHWIPFITGTTSLWILIMMVFIIAYVRKRRQRRLAMNDFSSDELDDQPPPPLSPESP